MVTLREAVEATLLGKDERLVAKCDVDGILNVFERWDIYDIETLQANLDSSYAELQEDLAAVAARSFLGLLKSILGTVPRPSPHDGAVRPRNDLLRGHQPRCGAKLPCTTVS